jgi:hypothetical protein
MFAAADEGRVTARRRSPGHATLSDVDSDALRGIPKLASISSARGRVPMLGVSAPLLPGLP